MYIYKITNRLNGKIYVGQTIRNVNRRFAEHCRKKDNTHLHNAMRLYGKENFRVEIVDTANSQTELDEKERYWIRVFNSDVEGYNETAGGDSNPMNNALVKSKHLHKMQSQSVRMQISSTMRQKYASGETFTAEHRAALSRSAIGNKKFAGHKRTQYAIERTAMSLRKSVRCVDTCGDVVGRFDSVKEAAVWWYAHGADKFYANVKGVMGAIKRSDVSCKAVHGMLWIYD